MEDIIDFLPIYPYIDDDNFNTKISKKKELYDDNFNTKISQKKELYDYKLEPYEKFPEKPGDLFNHQKLISRFFSSNTPYDQLLLFHDMGTGKTCTSVACIEQIKEENSNFKGAYIFTKGELLHKNYKHDLILKCNEKNKYFNGKTKSGNLSYTKIKEYYKFRTFQTFVSYLSKKSNEYIIENYSNYIIVIDEVHNIRMSYIDIDEDEEEDKNDQDDEDKTVKKEGQKKEIKEEMKKIYPQFHRFLHLIKNCKILLMSGTPMKDTFVEIADIMNLILPIGNQMPIKKEFIYKYFTKKNEDEDGIIYQLNNNNINELKSFFKGRVSYLKSMQSSIIKKFIGNKNYDELNKFIVHPVKMEDNQNKGYIDALQKDNKKNDNKSSFDYNSTLASLFVFPDSSYGKTGYNKYVDNGNLNAEFKTFIKKNGTNPENMLNQIAKCSTKYAFTIRKILENVKNIEDNTNRIKGKCMFVYSNKVSYGGTILFALLLNLFGFSSATSKIINKKAKRYILVKSEEGKNVNADIIKEVFNSSKNIYGEYISVVIGSRILSEGFSLFHIQEEFILTPYWNYSETDQAIARGIRSDSHNLLLDGFECNYLNQLDDSELENIMNKLNIDFSSLKQTNINNIIKNKKYIKQSPIKPEIHIYLLTSIPINKNISIDIKHYKKSEIKDMNNKIIERLIKESSFDCYFNYKRNRYNDSFNNLRECDYLPCEYKCDFKTSFSDYSDYSTDQLYYLNEDKNISIKNKILNIFKQKYYLTIDDVKKYSKSLTINMKYFFLFLFQIIDNKEIVYDRLGLECFMYENNNIFYISDSKINNNYLSIYYSENINIQKDYKSLNLLTDKSLDVNFIETLFKETDIHKIISKLLQLKVEVVEILLEEIILSKLNNIDNDFANDFAKLVFNNFLSKYCLEVEDENILYISWLKCNNNKMHNLRILIKKEDNNLIWIDSDSTKADSSDSVSMKKFKKFLGKLIKKSQDFFENYLKEMGEKIGYYGILAYDENKNQKFNIVKINELKNKKKEVVKKPETKSKKKDKESTSKDSRTKNTGRFCESWDKSELIYIIVKFKITFDDYTYKFKNDLDKFNSRDLDDKEFDKIKSYGKINKEDKKSILYLNKLKKTELCEIIQDSFQSNKLIINYFKY